MKNHKVRVPIQLSLYILLLFIGMFIPYVGYIHTATITYYPLLLIVVVSIVHLGVPAAIVMPFAHGLFAYGMGFPHNDAILEVVGPGKFFMLQTSPYVLAGVATSLVANPIENKKVKAMILTIGFMTLSSLMTLTLNASMVDLKYFTIGELFELNIVWLVVQSISTVVTVTPLILKIRIHTGIRS